jgi:hypothetical protein
MFLHKSVQHGSPTLLFEPFRSLASNSWRYSYRVAAIFPEHFQSFSVTFKKTFLNNTLPETVSAVFGSINKNKNTHSSKDKLKGSYKSRDSLQTLLRTYHERDAEVAQGEPYVVVVEEVWLPSSPDCLTILCVASLNYGPKQSLATNPRI